MGKMKKYYPEIYRKKKRLNHLIDDMLFGKEGIPGMYTKHMREQFILPHLDGLVEHLEKCTKELHETHEELMKGERR